MTLQTFEQIRRAALVRLAEFTDKYPSGREAPFRRIGVRQQQLYVIAAHVNPEYGGDCAEGELTDGAINFAQMSPPVATPERITRITILALEPDYEGDYEVGQEITVVPAGDPVGEVPRATLRRNVLRQVATDFEGITEIEVQYPYRPESTDSDEDGTREVVGPDPHSELLVVDLARDYIRKADAIEQAARTTALALLDAEEEELLELWTHHVREYAPLQARFARPPQAERKA